MGPVPAGGHALEFIRTLAVAWKNLSAYPPGHPALAGAVESAHRALNDLRGPGGEVVFGIASDGIVYGDEKIDSTQAQKFAQSLYGRGVAVVRFDGETTVSELETFLRLLTGALDDSVRPVWEELTALGVVNINLKPVDYSGVQLTEEAVESKPAKEQTSLWDDILRALVEGRELTPKARQLLSHDVRSVDELSAMILRYIDTADEPDTAEFDPDATFGVRLMARVPMSDSADAMIARVADAVGSHVGSSSGTKRQLAVQQVIQLLRSMPEPLRGSIIRSVLRPLATDETAGALLREVTATLEHDEVVEALRYLATVGKLSSHAIALIESLAMLESAGTAPQPAPASVIGELVELFGEDDIDRFNPPDHKSLLHNASIRMPNVNRSVAKKIEALGPRVDTIAPEAVDRQLADSIVELLSKFAANRDVRGLLWRAELVLRSQIGNGYFTDAIDLIERLREIALHAQDIALRDAIGQTLSNIASPETISTLVESLTNAPPEKVQVVHRLVEALGSAATRNLILALTEENNRSKRRRLLNLIGSLGTRIVPEAVPLLKDQRWYVVRNMLVLLRSVNDRTSLGHVRELAHHPDLRVRMEAIKTLLAFDTTVPQTLLEQAINDPKIAETAIALVGSYGIREAVPPLLRVLAGRDVFRTRKTLRLLAIKALGELADPSALPQMRQFFSNSILPWPAREERRAAYESLSGYPAEARAPIVERGLSSRDDEIRNICRRLSGS